MQLKSRLINIYILDLYKANTKKNVRNCEFLECVYNFQYICYNYEFTNFNSVKLILITCVQLITIIYSRGPLTNIFLDKDNRNIIYVHNKWKCLITWIYNIWYEYEIIEINSHTNNMCNVTFPSNQQNAVKTLFKLFLIIRIKLEVLCEYYHHDFDSQLNLKSNELSKCMISKKFIIYHQYKIN